MARILRDEDGSPFTTGEFVGPTPQVLYAEYLTQAGAVSGVPFHLVEIEVFRVASGGSVTWPLSAGLVPSGLLSLTPSGAATTATIRASDVGYRSRHSDADGVQPYRPLIAAGIPIDREVDLDPAIVGASVSWGQAQLLNDEGILDGVFGAFSASARTARLLRGTKTWDDSRGIWVDPAYADLTVLFSGIADSWLMDVNTLSIRMRDATFWLERPYQKNTFGGTGGYDGNSAVSGTLIPRTRGKALNITPVRIDTTRIIYKVNDGPVTFQHFYEGAAEVFTNDGDVGDLYSTTAPASGHVQYDAANGAFELGAEPVHAITVDCTGGFPTAGIKTNWADIARYILTEDMAISSSLVDTSSFAAAATAYPYDAGTYFAPDSRVDGVSAASRLLGAVGAKLIDGRGGALRCFVLRALAGTETPSLTITPANCASVVPVQLPSTLDPPPYRVRVAWNHNWTTQTGDFDGAATDAQKQFVGAEDTFATHENSAISAAYAQPNDLAPFGGALATSSDADAVATAVGTLWCNQRYLFDVTLPVSLAVPLDVGSVVRVIWPMGILRNGALGQVIGERYTTNEPSITLRILI